MKKYLIKKTGKFYKANLHCHSNISDGKLTPNELKELYKSLGYSIVAFTDHDVFIPHNDLTDENFLALNGFEVEIDDDKRHPITTEKKRCHLCFVALDKDIKNQVCWHREKYQFGNAIKWRDKVSFNETLPDYERKYSPECINDMIKKGRDANFFVTYNHPIWSCEDYSDYSNYKGMNAMEVVNYASLYDGYPEKCEREYDDIIRRGNRVYAVCADDNHNFKEDYGGGFVQIKADKLDYESIAKSLKNGQFYASTGPQIKAIYLEDHKLTVKTSGVKTIRFSTGKVRACAVHAEKGKTINTATFTVKDDDCYFRITAVDKHGECAYTHAYFIADLFK
ncbi:MAG: hypothetical protein J6V68_02840 [Clostridia bacterium]|nr:hypothetical protein [Clostridia bacterium]